MEPLTHVERILLRLKEGKEADKRREELLAQQRAAFKRECFLEIALRKNEAETIKAIEEGRL